MRTLSYTELPRTNDPRQVFTVDVTVDGTALHARVELRYHAVFCLSSRFPAPSPRGFTRSAICNTRS